MKAGINGVWSAFLILLISVFLLVSEGFSLDDSNYTIVKKLDQDWMIYNKKFNSYIYYLPVIHKNTHTINQWLEVEKYRNYQLGILATPGLAMFINNKLVYRNSESKSLRFSLPLSDFIKYSNDGKAMLTLYNSNFDLPLNEVYIFTPTSSNSFVHQNISSFKILKKEKMTGVSTYVIFFLLVLTSIAIVKHRYAKRFQDFFGFQNVLPNIWIEEIAILKIYSSPILLILIINAFLLAIITAICGGLPKVINLFPLFIHSESGLYNQLLMCGLIYLIAFLLKYFLLVLVSWIFNLTEIIKIQYFEFLKNLLKINIFVAVVVIIFASVYNTVEIQFLNYIDQIFLLIILIIVVRTAILIFKLSTFRNIYLFSYLCTTEIMPLAIITKIILFWNN